MATLRTGLTRKRRRYLLDTDAVLAGLVREHFLEFSERPIVHLTLHLVIPIVHPLADMGQAFDGDVRTVVGVGFLHDASRNRVQAVQHEAVFSPRQSPEYLLGGASVFVLKASTHAKVVVLPPQEFATIVERSRAGHGDVLQVQVHAENRVAVASFDCFLDDNVEVERALVFAVVERSHPFLVLVIIEVGFLVVPENVVHGDSAVDGREGQYHNGYYRPIRVCQCLSDWYLHGSLALKRKGKLASCEVPAQFKAGYESYVQYCNDAEYSDRGVYTRLNRIKRILLFLDSRGVTDFERVTAAEFSAFFATQIELQSRTVATMLASVRVFFRHLYHNEFTTNDLSQQLPKVKANREFKLPRVWREEDLLTVLNSIDRGNPVGKRDYAILMLITRYGLRSADVKSLKLSSLRWTTNQIEIVQNKTGNPLRLPLLRDVGWAIIDYLQNGRPPCDHEEVFITSTVPIRPFGRHSAGLNAILVKRIRQAGVKIPASVPKGMHSLRHTLASVMLANDVELPVISSVLGHVTSEATGMYLHTDLARLRECALDPEEVLRHAVK